MVAPGSAFCGRCGELVQLATPTPAQAALLPESDEGATLAPAAVAECRCGAMTHARLAVAHVQSCGAEAVILTGTVWGAGVLMPPIPRRVEVEPVAASVLNASDALDLALVGHHPDHKTSQAAIGAVREQLRQLGAALLGATPLRLPCAHCDAHRGHGDLGVLSLADPEIEGARRNFAFCSDDPLCVAGALVWFDQGGHR